MAEEAPCPPQYAGHNSLYEVLARAGLPVTSGRDVSCVNFGAKLSLGGRMDANHDAAWDFVLHGPSMRVAAFEPNPHDCHMLRRAVMQGAFARHNIAIECDFVRGATVAERLAAHGIPRDTLDLLKVDIDSADLSVTRAVLRGGFRPRLIYAELNQHVPMPIEFAALEPEAGEALNASYHKGTKTFAGYRGNNKIWPCFGASLGAWAALAPELGYVLLGTDRNNVLLVRSDVHAAGQFNTSSDAWCHAKTTNTGLAQIYRLRLARAPGVPPRRGDSIRWRPEADFDYNAALMTIESRCRENQTPYLLRLPSQRPGGEKPCCPASSRPWFANLTTTVLGVPDLGLCRGC